MVLELTGDLSQELLPCLYSVYGIISETTTQKLLQLILPTVMTPKSSDTGNIRKGHASHHKIPPQDFNQPDQEMLIHFGQLPKTACLEKNNTTRRKKKCGNGAKKDL